MTSLILMLFVKGKVKGYLNIMGKVSCYHFDDSICSQHYWYFLFDVLWNLQIYGIHLENHQHHLLKTLIFKSTQFFFEKVLNITIQFILFFLEPHTLIFSNLKKKHRKDYDLEPDLNFKVRNIVYDLKENRAKLTEVWYIQQRYFECMQFRRAIYFNSL